MSTKPYSNPDAPVPNSAPEEPRPIGSYPASKNVALIGWVVLLMVVVGLLGIIPAIIPGNTTSGY